MTTINNLEEEGQIVQMEPDETSEEIRTLFQEECQKWEGPVLEGRPRISKMKQNKNTKTTMIAITALE